MLHAWKMPPFEVQVRPLRALDVPHLEWHGGADWRCFYEQTSALHYAGDVLYLVADINGFPAAQIILYWRGKDAHPHIPDIQSFRVHPMLRGQGVGSELLRVAERVAQQYGRTQVSLSVALDNPKARRLYERCGYRVVGESYETGWETVDARGEPLRFRETILDMVKELKE